MAKILNTALSIVSGSLFVLFAGNLLVHFLFYLMDGSLAKFLSPIWMSLNGILLFLGLVFVFTFKKSKAFLSL